MRDKNIWLFNAGNAFAGNPKWLLLYIREHHPEIECHWLCYHRPLVEKIRALGFDACLYRSVQARRVGRRAGVYVVEQNKEVFQDYLEGITVLNLWHGVTVKKFEHAVIAGFMEEGVAAKHIRNEPVYRQQLMLVTSPDQERVFSTQCKVASDLAVRAPYPRCFERVPIATFDHDLAGARGLGPSTKVALYAPTFRDFDRSSFFSKAIPDIDALLAQLEQHDWLLVLKAHPQMERDFQLATFKREYGDCQRLLFWDDDDDIYEVLDGFDMAIVDYSSIMFDLVACGCKRFVRYAFDYRDKGRLREFAFDYLEVTCGEVCTDFESLLEAFAKDEPTDELEVARVFDWAWAYARDRSVEDIVQRALSYRPDSEKQFPVLYSYDVFDTLIARASGSPESVFSYVQDKMRLSDTAFPSYLERNFPKARSDAERCCRQLMDRTVEQRGDGRTEITFDMIFEHLRDRYGLDDGQVRLLQDWELEAEEAVSVPVAGNVSEALALADRGETVLLISDMYLPEAFVKRLLAKADPRLAELPLFLSSSLGRQKTKKGLFLDAYHSLDYRFSKWVHTGDDVRADSDVPSKLGIEPRLSALALSSQGYVRKIADGIGTFDASLVSCQIARMMAECGSDAEAFACGYASLYFVPYVRWVVEDAAFRGIERLYFISRDGYHLKRIADAVIARLGVPVETGYLYGSRKAWRLPSQIDAIDDSYFSSYGSFTGVSDYPSLLSAAGMDEASFKSMFPELAYLEGEGRISRVERDRIVERLRDSVLYRSFLLERSAEERPIVLDYLRQEIDFSQDFAFVEYWGRGYTQACHSRLLRAADDRAGGSTYYYARSILPTEGADVRLNFSDEPRSLLFAEALFANMPYRTVSGYRREAGAVAPILETAVFDGEVFDALCEWLPRFAWEYAGLGLLDADRTGRELFDFAAGYFDNHQSDKMFLRFIAPLKDSITMNGNPAEFAPRLSLSWLAGLARGDGASTKSKRMTVARANPLARCLISCYESRRLR